jgi:hypothetical protein
VGTASTADAQGAGRAAPPAGDPQMLARRLAVARVVVRDTSPWIDIDADSVDVIVDDVLRRWRARGQGGDEPVELDGPNGFWNQYADRIEVGPPRASDDDDEWRVEFCPPGAFDSKRYYQAVWMTHVAQLRAAVNREQVGA